MSLRRPLTAILLLLCAAGLFHPAQATENTPPTPPPAMVVSPQLIWRPSHWAGSTRNTELATRRLDPQTHRPVFEVHEPGKTKVWTHYFGRPIPWHDYPIVVLTYRATHIDKPGHYLLWLDDERGPNGGGRVVWQNKDLLDDGQTHELRCDLRTLGLQGGGTLPGMALGLSSTAAGQAAQLTLLDLRFEAAPDADTAPPPLPDGQPITVEVTDHEGRPMPGVQVRIDPDLENLTRTAQTDVSGRARLTPCQSPDHRHRLTITAPGQTTFVMCNTAGGRGRPRNARWRSPPVGRLRRSRVH